MDPFFGILAVVAGARIVDAAPGARGSGEAAATNGSGHHRARHCDGGHGLSKQHPAMKHQLFETLKQAGQQPCEHRNPDGSTVLILPHGGRLLGLFPPGSDENFFWTHSALEAAESASPFYAGSQWHNSGGERTWLRAGGRFLLSRLPQARSLLAATATRSRPVGAVRCAGPPPVGQPPELHACAEQGGS